MSDYLDLRAEVAKHLQAIARRYVGEQMKAGRVRLAVFERWVSFRSDVDAVDAVLEHAERYAHFVVCPLWSFDANEAAQVPGLPDYLSATANNTQAQNEAASAFFDAVAGRFDELRAKHVAFLALRSAALMARLERDASRMSAADVELWARYGMKLDQSAESVRRS